MTTLQILLVLVLALANGFFVAAEFALVKVRLSQIEQMAQQGVWTARLAKRVLLRIDSYLSACQLGITLASLGLGWAGERVAAALIEPVVVWCGLAAESAHYVAFPVGFVLLTALHITVGEQAPKILAIRTARSTTLATAPLLVLFYNVLWPAIWVLNHASNLLVRAFGVLPMTGSEATHSADELRLILAESAAGGELSRRERLMMENVLDLEDKWIRQVMVPRRDIVYVSTRRPIAENLSLISESRHTRFPLCDGDLDRLVGMIHTKDLLRELANGGSITTLTQLARKIPFFPETMRLDVLLREFQRNRTHVAMVVDEFGTISGMVTFENVLEELVGPIQDEFDRELPQIIRRSDGRLLIDGLCPVDDLLEQCELTLPDDISADTTGGLIIELLGHIPENGEKLSLGPWEVTVLDAEPTRIRRVEFVRAAQPPKSESSAASSSVTPPTHGSP